MISLTPKQRKLFEFIRLSLAVGEAPTFEAMRLHMGMSGKGQVHSMLGQIEDRGWIRRTKHRARAIEITATGLLPADIRFGLDAYCRYTATPRDEVITAALRQYFKLRPTEYSAALRDFKQTANGD